MNATYGYTKSLDKKIKLFVPVFITLGLGKKMKKGGICFKIFDFL